MLMKVIRIMFREDTMNSTTITENPRFLEQGVKTYLRKLINNLHINCEQIILDDVALQNACHISWTCVDRASGGSSARHRQMSNNYVASSHSSFSFYTL